VSPTARRTPAAALLALVLLVLATLAPLARADGKPPGGKKPPAFPEIEKKLDAGDIAGARQAYEKCLGSPDVQPKKSFGESLPRQWSREELKMIDERPGAK